MSIPIGAKRVTNIKLTHPFTNAASEVFKHMLGIETSIGEPYLKNDANATYRTSGIVDFYGKVRGSIVLSFDERGLDDLIQSFVGQKVRRDSSSFSDAVGELANMVAGGAKGRLGGVTGISTPRVFVNRSISIEGVESGPNLVVPCQTLFGAFTVEMYIVRAAHAA